MALEGSLSRNEKSSCALLPTTGGSAHREGGYAEVLLRWRHPDLGIVLPDELIPVPEEETSLIVPVGEWIRSTARAQSKARRRPGSKPANNVEHLRSSTQGKFATSAVNNLREVSMDPAA